MASAARLKAVIRPSGPTAIESGTDGLEDEVAKGLDIGEVPLLGLQARLRRADSARPSSPPRWRSTRSTPALRNTDSTSRAVVSPGSSRSGHREDGAPEHQAHVEQAGQPGHDQPTSTREEEAALHHREDVEEK